jgi:hypothetical protein
LLLAAATKKKQKEVSAMKNALDVPTSIQIPSYPWKKNSCWLDTSLELIFATVCYNFEEFSQICQKLPSDSDVRLLYNILNERQTLQLDKPDISAILSKQRNMLRSRLVQIGEAKAIGSLEPLFVSERLYELG